jgi:hypothetical protein
MTNNSNSSEVKYAKDLAKYLSSINIVWHCAIFVYKFKVLAEAAVLGTGFLWELTLLFLHFQISAAATRPSHSIYWLDTYTSS